MEHLFFKNKKAVLFLLVCVMIVFFASCDTEQTKFENNNFDEYLGNETHFEKIAMKVMPSKESLDGAEIISYEFSHYSDKMLRLVAVYSKEEFDIAKEKMEGLYQKNLKQSNSYCEKFYLDGELYNCFTFYVNDGTVNAYAMSYSVDAYKQTISYILYESDDLEYMSAASALSLYLEECKIVSVK